MPLPFHLFIDRDPCNAASSSAHSPTCLPESPLRRPMSRFPVSRVSCLLGWLCLLIVSFAAQGALSPLHAESAKNYFKAGKQAEIREDYINAYEITAKPGSPSRRTWNTKRRISASNSRPRSNTSPWAASCRAQGQLNDALTDFLRALEIDPSNEAAEQEAQQVRALINGKSAVQQPSDQMSVTSAQDQRELQSLSGPLQLKPISDEPITIHMVADTKVIYQTIGKLAGINILFDPDYTSKRIPIDLDRVTLYDALRSVAFVSQTFWRPVTADTIFVATDNRQKRAELEEQAVQTFYLGNIAQANDLNEVLNAVRNLMDTTVKMQAVPSQNAIVMRGTPDQLLLAQKIIDDLDKAKPEVVVDMAVLEVNKDLLRNIGLQLPAPSACSCKPPLPRRPAPPVRRAPPAPHRQPPPAAASPSMTWAI